MSTDYTPERMADRAWDKLLDAARNGMPPVYLGVVNDFMCDWWMDLPWDIAESRAAYSYLLRVKPTVDFVFITEHLGIDMVGELTAGLKED